MEVTYANVINWVQQHPGCGVDVMGIEFVGEDTVMAGILATEEENPSDAIRRYICDGGYDADYNMEWQCWAAAMPEDWFQPYAFMEE